MENLRQVLEEVQDTQAYRTTNPHRKKTASKNKRKKKETPRIAANTVEKQDSIPLDLTAQLMDSSAWSMVSTIIMQPAVDQDQTRDKIANTFSRQHDTSYIELSKWDQVELRALFLSE